MDIRKIVAKVIKKLALVSFEETVKVIKSNNPVSMPRIFRTWISNSKITDKTEIKKYLEKLKEEGLHKLNTVYKKGFEVLTKIYKITDFKLD